MGEKIETSQFLGLKELLPEASRVAYFKVDKLEGWTIWHLSQNLKIKQKWLAKILDYPGNNETLILDKKTLVGKKLDNYYWGEPRLGNEYAVTGDVWNYHLYMKKWNDVVYIRIPDWEIIAPKVKESIRGSTKMALSELKDEIQSA